MQLSKQGNQTILLYCSTLVGTLLGVLSSVINTRFLDPINYGDVRYVQNIVNLVASILLFGYFWSGSRLLALSNSEEYNRRIRGVMVLILIMASIVLLLCTLLCGVVYYEYSKIPVADLFLVSSLVCFNPLLLNYVNTTAQGDNHIGRLSAARILPTLMYIPIAYLIFSRYGANSANMIVLQWGAASVILFVIVASTRPSFKNLKPIFKELVKENKHYGIHLYYGSLAMVATNYLAGVTLGLFNSDNANVGFYTLALSVTVPLQMLPSIIGTTYFKKFATQDRISREVMRNTIALTTISCFLFILLIKPIVNFFYSSSYELVGTYATWLAVGFSIHGFGDMINRYLGSHGEGVSIRNSSFVCGALKISGYIVLVYLWDIKGALFTTVISSLAYTLVIIYSYIRFVKKTQD